MDGITIRQRGSSLRFLIPRVSITGLVGDIKRNDTSMTSLQLFHNPHNEVYSLKTKTQGYTLVELVVVMAIFVIVIMVVGQTFSSVLSHASKLFKSEESNIEGIIGLEVMRHDLNNAGFGLFTEATGANYQEASNGISASPALNDAPNDPPRPIIALERSAANCSAATTDQADNQNYTLIPCSDYLSVKGTSLGTSSAAKRWTYLNYSSHAGGASVKPTIWNISTKNPQQGDSVVVVSKNSSSLSNSTVLMTQQVGGFYYQFSSTAFNSFTSASTSAAINVYGVGSGALRMPFNRADFFVAKPPLTSQISATCAPGTGVLYKAMVNQTDGNLTYMPLMDCVAGMQIVLGWDTNGDGVIDTWSNADGTQVSGAAPSATVMSALTAASNASSTAATVNIRNNLKMVKVYILAQVGKKDTNYSSPTPILAGDTGELSLTYSYDIAASGWLNYRWKLYEIVVTPKNLNSNQ